MSAFPRDPEHFFRWVRQHHDPQAQPQDFVPRRVYGDYVEGLLRTAAEYPGNARLVRRQAGVVGIDRRGDRLVVRLDDGATDRRPRRRARHRVPTAGTDWAPAELAASGRLLDPWTDELPDGDLLLVGTGLTMVDVAIAADRPGRTLHTRLAPRRGPRPRTCCRPPRPCRRRPASPACTPSTSCAAVRARPRRADRRRDRRLARGHRRPAPGHRPAVARPLRRRPADLPRRRRARLGRPPPPDAAGHRRAGSRRSTTSGRWSGTPARSRRRAADVDGGVDVTLSDGSRADRRRRRQLHRPGRRAGQGPAAAPR